MAAPDTAICFAASHLARRPSLVRHGDPASAIVAAGVLFALALPSPLFTDADKAAVLLGGLGAGLTTILEEIGWTGFVLPRLRRRHSIPRSTCVSAESING